MTEQKSKFKYILVELAHHLPFSIFGVSVAMIVLGFLNFFAILMGAEASFPMAAEELYHVFHPTHVLFSAVATTAMLWKHDRRLIRTILIGFFGSITVCGISDYVIPYWGGILLGLPMEMHICIIETPDLVIPFAVVGVIAGLLVTNKFEKSTEYSHSTHVFISSTASILYLIAFGWTEWVHALGAVFLVTIAAVMLPCCASDIALPLACSHKFCKHKQPKI